MVSRKIDQEFRQFSCSLSTIGVREDDDIVNEGDEKGIFVDIKIRCFRNPSESLDESGWKFLTPEW